MPLTPAERARVAANARWQRDPKGLDRHIQALLDRAPAITPEQRARLAVLLRNPHPAAAAATTSSAAA